MRLRITLWAGAGFLVACGWALFVFVTSPHTNERMQAVWILAGLTCPIILAGSHFPLGLYQVLAANTATYALLGLILETLRRRPAHRVSYP
jgi:hypothetical protein